MALDSSWWSTNWENVKLSPTFSDVTPTLDSDAGAGTNSAVYAGFAEDCLVHNYTHTNKHANYDLGHFYLEYATDSQKFFFDAVVSTNLREGTPVVSSDSVDYPIPFHDGKVESYTSMFPAGAQTVSFYWNINYSPSQTVSCDLKYYGPTAFSGFAGRVIAAILLEVGLSSTYIDTDAFSDADDGHDSVSGDFQCYVRRKIGETVSDTIKRVARHCWDILTVNLDGEIALVSRNNTGTDYTVASIDQDDGVISVQWRYAFEHLANVANAVHGEWVRERGAATGLTSDSDYTHESESHFRPDASTPEWYFTEYEDSSSRTKYGDIQLETGDFSRVSGSEVEDITYFHLPYFLTTSAKAGMMARLGTTEGTLRREVTIVQDLRGLDYDVGYKITSLGVTNDGDTFTAFCTKKTIDFNDLSVTSTFLEEPS